MEIIGAGLADLLHFLGGFSPFLPEPFGMPTLLSLLKFGADLDALKEKMNSLNSPLNRAVATQWEHILEDCHIGQEGSHEIEGIDLVELYGDDLKICWQQQSSDELICY